MALKLEYIKRKRQANDEAHVCQVVTGGLFSFKLGGVPWEQSWFWRATSMMILGRMRPGN